MATPQTSSTGQIQTREKPKGAEEGIIQLINRMGPELARAVPKHVTADRMARLVTTAIRTTPKLATCTPVSFIACVMSCAQLGLEPNTPLGHAYLIPRNNRRSGKVDCTMIIGYQGMLELSYRSGFLRSLDVDVVKLGDAWQYERGLNPVLAHKPSDDKERERQAVTHAWAVFHLKGGADTVSVLSRAQIEMRRQRSTTPEERSPWKTDYDAMAMKTVIRAGWKWIPKSTEIARAIALDEAPEIGRSQMSVADPEIVNLLQSQGLEPDASEPDPETVDTDGASEDHDRETGEMVNRASQAAVDQRTASGREPGID